MWVPPEVKEPVLLHAPTRKSVGYFGAVRLRDGKFFYAREEEKFNAQSCWQFLKQLHSKSLRSAKRVIIILDNAKYHHALLHKAWREDVKPRFTLDFLPPYSPELNPIERVWKLTRRLCLHNVYFPKLDQVCISAERQFDRWSAGAMRSKNCAHHIDTQLFFACSDRCQPGRVSNAFLDIARFLAICVRFVEQEETHAKFRAIGVDFAQGYYFGMPGPAPS